MITANSTQASDSHRFCIAPMMKWTDRHYRYMSRVMSKRLRLYTEMVTANALLHNSDTARFLDFNACEHPVALQLGGSEPDALARAAEIGQKWGYGEINLNCGCPSERVQSGAFGACLMGEPELVARCVSAMMSAVHIPVTVKSRIGIDEQDSYAFLQRFTEQVANTGCETLIVHARKAWLSGLSPKENREIPPLMYDRVYQLKQEFPELNIVINGGIQTLSDCQEPLEHTDGVMLGRSVYQDPYILSQVDQQIYGETTPVLSRMEVALKLREYIEAQLAQGQRLHSMTRHYLGLFNQQKGARQWRRILSEKGNLPNAGIAVFNEALSAVNGEN
ncbi:MAG: tRNA dihydrouridine(20/20a) synthase DusA [Pseudomonadota bacterium]|nr:tRNA dihydrouridine(20/20a) synthase DusA [Pseudomonadota bacterium]